MFPIQNLYRILVVKLFLMIFKFITTIKTDLSLDIGLPNVQQPLAKENGEIDSVWFSFFEKSYKATGATFGLPSAQEKLGKNWNDFFQKK